MFSKTLSLGKARQAVYVMRGSRFKRAEHLENGLSEVIVLDNGSVKVCGVYRPFKNINSLTSGAAFDLLLGNLENITKCNSDLIIGGDFNVNWTDHPLLPKLCDWMEKCGLIQQVNSVTRTQIVSKIDGIVLNESCIDLVFVKMEFTAQTYHPEVPKSKACVESFVQETEQKGVSPGHDCALLLQSLLLFGTMVSSIVQ